MRLIKIAALCLMAVGALAAQTSKQPETTAGVIRLSTKEVILDLVVRDKKNRIVRDLKADEIEVYEDGVLQKVQNFEYVEGAEQLSAETSAASATAAQNTGPLVNSLRQVNFVTIVFGPMAVGNFDFARQAVFTFLKSGSLTNTFVTVYRLDTRLRLIQPYTQDLGALQQAATAATKMTPGGSGPSMANTVLGTQSLSTATATMAAATLPGGGNPMATPSFNTSDPSFTRFAGTLDASTAMGQAALAQGELANRTRFVENYATGMTMLDSLRELIRSQSRVQGRKVVLYLSDGLALPQGREDVFSQIVSDSNRSGVTFFTLDTRGLSSDDPMAASVTQQNRITQEGALQSASNRVGVGSASFDVSSVSEDVELQTVADKQMNLRSLAERTGGFATANTNELATPMQRVMEDIRSHYQLAYRPTSDVYDGHFRKIEVKLARPKMVVQTRRGYYALPELNGQPLQNFELTALNAINTRPLPRTFSYRTALMQFKPDSETVECEMFFEVPIQSLSFVQDAKTGQATLRASVFALIQDAKGEVVGKISREVRRSVANGEIGAVKDQTIVYAEPIDLAPGRYTLSTVVNDEQREMASVKRVSVSIEPIRALGISSIEIVERVDPLSGPRNPADPFEMDDRRVTLSSAESVKAGRPIPLYFVIYPGTAGTNDALKLTLRLLKDGKEVARTSPELPKPDSKGAVPMVLELSPAAGEYDVQISVQQGGNRVQAERTLTVEAAPR